MKIITIAIVEVGDVKPMFNDTKIKNLKDFHLTPKIPEGVDAVFFGPNGEISELVDVLNTQSMIRMKNLSDY